MTASASSSLQSSSSLHSDQISKSFKYKEAPAPTSGQLPHTSTQHSARDGGTQCKCSQVLSQHFSTSDSTQLLLFWFSFYMGQNDVCETKMCHPRFVFAAGRPGVTNSLMMWCKLAEYRGLHSNDGTFYTHSLVSAPPCCSLELPTNLREVWSCNHGLFGPSPGWKHLLALSYLRHY